MSSPYNNLKEIEARKKVLRKQIKSQESCLKSDVEAFREDIDTVKSMWANVMKVRNWKEKSGVAKVTGLISENPSLTTALTVGGKILSWVLKRKRK